MRTQIIAVKNVKHVIGLLTRRREGSGSCGSNGSSGRGSGSGSGRGSGSGSESGSFTGLELAHESSFMRCGLWFIANESSSLCLGVGYCSNQCQKAAWPAHKEPFKLAAETRSMIGVHTIEEFDKSFVKMKMDAEAGNEFAQYCIGLCFTNVTGAVNNERKAVKWYMRAAKGGNANAMSDLGNCYKNGSGIAVNAQEACKWWLRCARLI